MIGEEGIEGTPGTNDLGIAGQGMGMTAVGVRSGADTTATSPVMMTAGTPYHCAAAAAAMKRMGGVGLVQAPVAVTTQRPQQRPGSASPLTWGVVGECTFPRSD